MYFETHNIGIKALRGKINHLIYRQVNIKEKIRLLKLTSRCVRVVKETD
jgi:hypothetical protein